MGPAVAAALALLLVAFAPRAASAHVLGVSRGEYALDGRTVHADLVVRTDDARLAVPGLHADSDATWTEHELQRAGPALQAAFFDELAITADSARCTPALDGAVLEPPDALRLRATYTCPRLPTHVHFLFGFLDRMPAGHRHLATVHLPQGDVDSLAVLSSPEVDVSVTQRGSRGFYSLLRAGIEHILTGADHLAFLLALVLGGTLATRPGEAGGPSRTRIGPLVTMLTAFTVGHSISLAIATLGGFAPGPRLVEPAVALSVAYVGAENLFARSVAHRWLLTLPFGLVHGFALAGGLLLLGLPRSELPFALFAFNLGVEVGQLLVLGVLLVPIALVRSRGWYSTAARALSAAIVLAGLAWFVQRIA